MKYTKQELINKWLQLYPSDKSHSDLEFNALAGTVLCKDGFYMYYKDWSNKSC